VGVGVGVGVCGCVCVCALDVHLLGIHFCLCWVAQ
jgi:hypothetical protein